MWLFGGDAGRGALKDFGQAPARGRSNAALIVVKCPFNPALHRLKPFLFLLSPILAACVLIFFNFIREIADFLK